MKDRRGRRNCPAPAGLSGLAGVGVSFLMAMYVYSTRGEPVGFVMETFIHTFDGAPVGRILGSRVHRFDGT